jgi:hypothetical protein
MVVAGQNELPVLSDPGAVFEVAEIPGVGAVGPEFQEAGGAQQAVFSRRGAGAVGVEPEFWQPVVVRKRIRPLLKAMLSSFGLWRGAGILQNRHFFCLL